MARKSGLPSTLTNATLTYRLMGGAAQELLTESLLTVRYYEVAGI